MEEILLNNIKNEILNILCVFDEYCKRNNIRYVLGYGTLLGAIRHKGFIPWDDDIDVVLTTKEYYRLRSLAKTNPYLDDNKRYKILIPGDKNYCYSFMKVVDEKYTIREKNISAKYSIGLYIDIFRVDYWPESRIVETLKLKYARTLLNINKVIIRGEVSSKKYKILDKALIPLDLILKLFRVTTEKVVLKLERTGTKNKRSVYIGNMMEGSGKKSERLPAIVFDNIVLVDFENHKFPAPKEYDLFLKTIYGNYMKIPSKENQISHDYDIIEK